MSKKSNWVRAGLIGAAAVLALQLLGIIPCLGCPAWPLVYVAYGCAGALAAYWVPPLRQPGLAAGHGALAGAIAGAIGGAYGLFLALVVPAVFVPFSFLSLPLETTRVGSSALWETLAAMLGSLTCGSGCYAVGVGIAAGLGALGGVVFAAVRPE
jgi:hypothetical protein